MITAVAFAMLRMLSMQAKWQSRLKGTVLGLAKGADAQMKLSGQDRCAAVAPLTHLHSGTARKVH